MALRSALINIIFKAASKAARRMMRDFGEAENLQVSRKGAADFVSQADLSAERTLKDELEHARPGWNMVVEETGYVKGASSDAPTWIIDPLDGTTNFLHGIPHFAICIALQSKKEIVSGLIFDPIKDEMFFSEKNKGAYLNNQRLRVSKKNDINDCLFSSNHDGVKFSNFNMRFTGCAALDLAYVAAGRFDGFFHNDINLWDVAAGSLMVQEAGGIVNDVYKFKNNAINIRASSDGINDKMLKELQNF